MYTYIYIHVRMCVCKLKQIYKEIILVFNKHQVSSRGVSRWFTEADVKYFKRGALQTITNITRSMVN